MREKDITPEIIKLSKEIAEIWRMEIYEGCWIVTEEHPKWARLVTGASDNKCRVLAVHYYTDDCIPIPSISDCLEKVAEYAAENITIFIDASMIWFVTLDMYTKKKKTNESKSLHEALLSALLAVLKEGK